MKTNPCRLTYSQLLRMLGNANYAHDMFWDLGLYDQAIRYTKIAQRILSVMVKKPIENVLYSEK